MFVFDQSMIRLDKASSRSVPCPGRGHIQEYIQDIANLCRAMQNYMITPVHLGRCMDNGLLLVIVMFSSGVVVLCVCFMNGRYVAESGIGIVIAEENVPIFAST